MRTRSALAMLFLVALVAAGCTRDASPEPSPTATPLAKDVLGNQATGGTLQAPAEVFKEFLDQLQQYLDQRKKVEDSLPRLTETKDQRKIEERAQLLAAGIASARVTMKQGAIFTPRVSAEFRRILSADAASRTPAEKANIMAEVPENPPVVNGQYPTDSPKGPAALASFPPKLLGVLPELPDTVEYRFLGQSLVLRDTSANLIIDYLPSVAPAKSGGGGE